MKTLLVALLVVTLAGPAMAELTEGTIEVGGMAAINDYDADGAGSDLTLSNIEAMVNFFMSDYWSLGLNLDALDIDLETLPDITVYGLSIRGDYYFTGDTNVIPFVGARVGIKDYDAGDLDDTDLSYGAQGGVKFAVTDNTYVNVEAVYEMFEVDSKDVDRLGVLVGVSFTF